MLLSDTGAELVDHLERQRDIPSLLASFQRLILAHGMDCFCIGDPAHPEVQRDDRRWGATWPVSWWWRYVSQNYIARDPVVARMNHSALPFRWSETRALAPRTGRRVLDEAGEFGLTDGLALAVHGEGTVGAVSIAAQHYELSPHQQAGLQLAAYYLHARVASLRAKGAPRTPRVLAPRERECLNWVAAGKTDWEISQILNISEQTAHGYVQNALSKLGARTRAQAVALALLSSQIQV
jgi:LuxR family quorum sensing-dependent transcriptional regulator